MTNDVAALVIGGGFYGCEIALELHRLGLGKIVLTEREGSIMRRASYVNQARVHNGYHYPRGIMTAQRSRMNFEPFVSEYTDAIMNGVESVYAIARGSRVSPPQFEAFCRTVGLPYQPAPRRISSLFDQALIEEAFITRECTFNSATLAKLLTRRIAESGIQLRLNQESSIVGWDDACVEVQTGDTVLRAGYVFNCTYGNLGTIGIPLRARLKQELAEMLLIEPPPELRSLAVTVMDGPFFSTVPFPPAGLHTLSHVRYTPHESRICARKEMLRPTQSNGTAMIRDASRYLPCLGAATIVRSLFEVKVVLLGNENDDARPIMIEQFAGSPRVFSVLGSKIDNIYDVRSFLRAQDWNLSS